MKHRLNQWLQISLHCCLRYPVTDRRYPKLPAASVCLWNFHPYNRWRELAPRRHSVPNLIELIFQICLKILHRLPITTGATRTPFDVQISLPDKCFGYFKGFCRTHRFLPFQVDQSVRLNDAAPLLHDLSIASSLLRAAPSLCLALVLFSFRGLLLRISPFTSKRQVPTFPTRA